MNSILNFVSLDDLDTQSKKTSNEQISIKKFENCSKSNNLKNFNTGFGKNNDLHFENSCKHPKLKTPLYKESYLKEFVTEEEKAAARHSLGLYNKDDVVAMSLLTTEDSLPTQNDWENVHIKQMRKGDLFFTPITQFKAVYDNEGITLDVKLKEVNKFIFNLQEKISNIINISNSSEITSLGDVKLFLKGFNNNTTLKDTINEIDQKALRFDIIGTIN